MISFHLLKKSNKVKAVFRTKHVALLALILLVSPQGVAQDQDDYPSIREKMRLFSDLVGTWQGTISFQRPERLAKDENVVYKISWVLDSTYLRWDAVFTDMKDPKRKNSHMMMMTFDPISNKYSVTYFYGRNSRIVREDGIYLEKTREFKTRGFIPLDDGVHDEYLRTITQLAESNRMKYYHYSRLDYQKDEHLDAIIDIKKTSQIP